MPLVRRSCRRAKESSTVKTPSTSPCSRATRTRAVEPYPKITLMGSPAAASIVGIIPVGVVLPSEPRVNVRRDDLRSSNFLMPVLDRT